MRNEEIRAALNTVSPTREQKARMRSALERQLPQTEAPRYRGRPAKPRRLSWLPAAAALLAVAVGGALALVRGPVRWNPGAPSAAEAPEQTGQAQWTGLETLLSSPEYRARAAMERGDSEAAALMGKYGLISETDGDDTDGWELAEQLGISRKDDAFSVASGRYYSQSGSSAYDGSTNLGSILVRYRVCYNANQAVVEDLPVLAEEERQTWRYGSNLTLALGTEEAVIYSRTEGGFLLVYTRDIRAGEELERFAGTFRFPDAPPQTAPQRLLEGQTRYGEILGQYESIFRGGTGSRSWETAAAIRERGAEGFGYALADLDGDGADELLMTDGVRLYGVYTCSGGVPEPLLRDDGETVYYLTDDGVLFRRGEDGFYAYRIESGVLTETEHLVRRSDPTAPLVRLTPEGETAISQEQWEMLQSGYRGVSLDYSLLSQWDGYEAYTQARQLGLEEQTAFGEVVEKYRTAQALGWDPGRCQEEDISLLTALGEGEIGYALEDLDGDGSRELLITDGNILYGLYVLEGGEARSVLLSRERLAWFLCEDGWLYCHGSNSAAVSVDELYRLNAGVLTLEETLTTDYAADPDSPWFRGSTGTGDTLTPITEAEYTQTLKAHPQTSVPFTPLSQWAG